MDSVNKKAVFSLVFFMFLSVGFLQAQNDTDEHVFVIVEESAHPVGGMNAFYDYVKKNLKYPTEAKRLGIEGKVFLSFIVEKDGSISNIKVIRGIGGGCDAESVRILEGSKWVAGKQRGRAVRQKMTFPINYVLTDNKVENSNVDEVSAEPTGGFPAFTKYLKENMEYPKKAKRKNIEGKVFVSFVVEKDGSLSDIKVEKGIGGGCDEEAIRLMQNCPNWIPGKQNGSAIRQKMTLPIFFKQ